MHRYRYMYRWGILTVIGAPKQWISRGCGSHSPFPIHVDELAPSSPNPGGQWKVTMLPSTAGAVWPKIITELSTMSSGFPQIWAARIDKKVIHYFWQTNYYKGYVVTTLTSTCTWIVVQLRENALITDLVWYFHSDIIHHIVSYYECGCAVRNVHLCFWYAKDIDRVQRVYFIPLQDYCDTVRVILKFMLFSYSYLWK